MTKQVNELMALVNSLLFAPNHLRKRKSQELRTALEAVLKPGEPVGYRYKFRNFMGDEVWSFELPRDGKVLEAVPVYTAPPAQTINWDALRHSANEWADMATNGLQWIRNIVDGISDPKAALKDMELNLKHCREVDSDPAVKHACRAATQLARSEPRHNLPAPPAQTPPRLTEELILSLTRDDATNFRWPSSALAIARAIESSVRKQFGVNDE